jgi:hypothetical protein
MIAEVSREAVLAAMRKVDDLGRERVRERYGYRRGSIEVSYRSRRYDSKVVIGIGYGLQNRRRPLSPHEFSGGLEHSARRLVHLGFAVWRDGQRLTPADVAIPQRLSLPRTSAELRLYVCRPTSQRAVAACYANDFGTLISPLSVRTVTTGAAEGLHVKVKRAKLADLSGHVHPLRDLPFVIDNGAWACHMAMQPWTEEPLLRLLERIGWGSANCPQWAVLPDIVGGGEASLDRSIEWLNRHRNGVTGEHTQWLLAVQDGMAVDQVRAAVERYNLAGIFVGGTAGRDSPNWKWRTVHLWAELGLDLGVRVHVGRVNTIGRTQLCDQLGVSSIDGSSVSKFANSASDFAACDGDDRVLPRSRENVSESLRQRIATVEPRARQAIAERKFRLALGSPP